MLTVTKIITIVNNTRFSISIHILTLLAYTGERWLSSEYMAKSININPAMLRKEISNLREYGLVESKTGRYGGTALAKPAEKILLSDVYKAVNPTSALGPMRDQPNPKCPVGNQINKHLNQLHKETERTILSNLNNQTLADFCRNFR